MEEKPDTPKPARRKKKQVTPMSYSEATKWLKLAQQFVTACNQADTPKAEKLLDDISDFAADRFR